MCLAIRCGDSSRVPHPCPRPVGTGLPRHVGVWWMDAVGDDGSGCGMDVSGPSASLGKTERGLGVTVRSARNGSERARDESGRARENRERIRGDMWVLFEAEMAIGWNGWFETGARNDVLLGNVPVQAAC